MNEIEKMYKSAGIDKIGTKKCTPAEFSDCQNYCFISENNKCDKFSFDYPPFTAEKQLELLKICFDKYKKLEKVRGLKERCIIYYRFDKNGYTEFVNCETWEETIAGLINNLWQDLTEEEKQQIKEILSE